MFSPKMLRSMDQRVPSVQKKNQVHENNSYICVYVTNYLHFITMFLSF